MAGFVIDRYTAGPLSLEGGFRFGSAQIRNQDNAIRSFRLYDLSLGAGYQVSPSLFLTLNVSHMQRAPTQTELFSEGPHLATASFERGDANLRKERAISIEGGARWEKGRFSLEANGFTHSFNGFVALARNGEEVDGLPVFVYTQRDARFIGGEVLGKAKILQGAAFQLSTDASIDIVRAAFQGGEPLPRIPPTSARLGVEGGSGPFKLRFEWERNLAQRRTSEFESDTAGYDIFNARLNFKPIKDGPLSLLIQARNLTDEEARVHTSFVKDLLPRPGRNIRFAAIVDF